MDVHTFAKLGLLVLGLFALGQAVLGLILGRVWNDAFRPVYRTSSPFAFWLTVVLSGLVGAVTLVAAFLVIAR